MTLRTPDDGPRFHLSERWSRTTGDPPRPRVKGYGRSCERLTGKPEVNFSIADKSES
jgi:hypothetical protein